MEGKLFETIIIALNILLVFNEFLCHYGLAKHLAAAGDSLQI
jgi:hypothetical protein